SVKHRWWRKRCVAMRSRRRRRSTFRPSWEDGRRRRGRRHRATGATGGDRTTPELGALPLREATQGIQPIRVADPRATQRVSQKIDRAVVRRAIDGEGKSVLAAV